MIFIKFNVLNFFPGGDMPPSYDETISGYHGSDTPPTYDDTQSVKNFFKKLLAQLITFFQKLFGLKQNEKGDLAFPENKNESEEAKELKARFLEIAKNLKSSDDRIMIKAVFDAMKLLQDAKSYAKNNNISMQYPIFEDSEKKKYISLGLEGVSEDELNEWIKGGSNKELSSRYRENRYYLDTKQVGQYEFNHNLTYCFGLLGELHKDFMSNYRESLTNDTTEINAKELEVISQQIDHLNDNNIKGLEIQSSAYKYNLDAILVKKTNKSTGRRGLFEKIDLRGKTSEGVKDIINDLPKDARLYECRGGKDVFYNNRIMPLLQDRKELLLDRIDEASKMSKINVQ